MHRPLSAHVWSWLLPPFFFKLCSRTVTEIKFMSLILYELISFASFHSTFHFLCTYSGAIFMTWSFYIVLENYQIGSPTYTSFCERYSPLFSWQVRKHSCWSLSYLISNSYQILWIVPSKYLQSQSMSPFFIPFSYFKLKSSPLRLLEEPTNFSYTDSGTPFYPHSTLVPVQVFAIS